MIKLNCPIIHNKADFIEGTIEISSDKISSQDFKRGGINENKKSKRSQKQ
jgi:hypothetical protein